MNNQSPPSDDKKLNDHASVWRNLLEQSHLSDADVQWAFMRLSAEHALQGDSGEAQKLGIALAKALLEARGDSKALIQGLGLAQKPGRKPIGVKSLLIGGALAAAEDAGIPPELALDGIAEGLARHGEDVPDRSTLQGWRDAARAYLKAHPADK